MKSHSILHLGSLIYLSNYKHGPTRLRRALQYDFFMKELIKNKIKLLF